MPLTNLAALIPIALLVLWGSLLQAEELNIFFKTTPRLEILRPFDDPADMALLVTGADGRPVEQGTVDIQLDAPRPGRFFSTDFPLIEGTRLSEMRLTLRRGRANWKYLFPIRGEYRLAVAALTGDGSKASKTFTFKIRENRQKWVILGAFSLGLFILGFVGGRIFTPSGVRTSLLVAALLTAASASVSDGQELAKPLDEASLEVGPAVVGKPSHVNWRVNDRGMGARPKALLTLTITHLEKGKVVFAIERLPVAGQFAMDFHFTDGAQYRVTAIADVAGIPTIRTEQVVSVTGVEPPPTAMLPALSFLLFLIALGLGVGRWSKRRSSVVYI